MDPIDAYRKATTCPFCLTKFSDVIKLIPDCGKCICGACYDDLKKNIDESREFNCNGCGQTHVQGDNEFLDCTQFLDLLRHPIEKPLSDQAKRLKRLIENVQEEMTRLQAFDPRDHIEHHCVQLEHEVSQTAQSAVKHIHEIEKSLLDQIRTYRQRCLDASAAQLSESSNQSIEQQASFISKNLGTFTKKLNEFSTKWDDYFKRLNALASDIEVESAIQQADAFQVRIKTFNQELRNGALCDSLMQFNPSTSFHSASDHLGQLVEISTKKKQKTNKMIRLQEQPSKTLAQHSGSVYQVVFLTDGRLVSCSFDKLIKVWDTSIGKVLFSLSGHTSHVYSIAKLPNGWLASGSEDKTIKLWNVEERKEVRTLTGHTDSIVTVKVLSKGNLVSYSLDDTIKIWNPCLVANNLLLTITGHGNINALIPIGVLSNDFLVACSHHDEEGESTMRVWKPTDGQLFKSVSTGVKDVWSVLVLSDDQVAIGTLKGTIKLIDPEDDSKTKTNEKAYDSRVTSLLQLSNGNLVSGGEDKQGSSRTHSIKVWNISDLALLQQINTGHLDAIFSLSITDDETLLASGSLDNTIKLWPISFNDAESD